MIHFDAIVIGSGQGGTPLAKKLGKRGLKTALIERRFVGGTCVNDGCTPTKAMVASARAFYLATNSAELGVNVTGASLDFDKVVARKNEIVERFRNGSQKGLEETENLELIFGEASFIGPKQLLVNKPDGTAEEYSADRIFINTGAAPSVPNIQGINDIDFLTSTTILDIKQVPEHLLVIGASYVGLEFGQMFSRFGSRVTILETGEKFLPKEDRDIAKCMFDILTTEGINILIGTQAKELAKHATVISCKIEHAGKAETIQCSHVLLAAGRTPQTAALNLQAANVTINSRGYIEVNDKLETSADGIYALGDVKGGPAFTHISYNDHVVLLKNLFEGESLSVHDRLIPYCMFTDPQLGRVGITEDEAAAKKLNYKVATLSMENVARAIETGETKGIMKAVVDADSGKILGAAIIGEEGGEIMSVLEMAIMGNVPYSHVRYAIFAHPLYSESLNNLFLSLEK